MTHDQTAVRSVYRLLTTAQMKVLRQIRDEVPLVTGREMQSLSCLKRKGLVDNLENLTELGKGVMLAASEGESCCVQ